MDFSNLIKTSKSKQHPNIDGMLKFEPPKITEHTVVLKPNSQTKPIRLLDSGEVLKKSFEDCILLLLNFPKMFSELYPTIDLSSYRSRICMRNWIILNEIKLKLEYSLFDPSVVVKNEEKYIIDDNEDCSICFYPFEKKVTVLSCGHHFHEDCIKKWVFRKMQHKLFDKLKDLIKKNKFKISCPICKRNLFEEIYSIYKKTIISLANNKNLKIEQVERSQSKEDLLSIKRTLMLKRILSNNFHYTRWQFKSNFDCLILDYFNYDLLGKSNSNID